MSAHLRAVSIPKDLRQPYGQPHNIDIGSRFLDIGWHGFCAGKQDLVSDLKLLVRYVFLRPNPSEVCKPLGRAIASDPAEAAAIEKVHKGRKSLLGLFIASDRYCHAMSVLAHGAEIERMLTEDPIAIVVVNSGIAQEYLSDTRKGFYDE